MKTPIELAYSYGDVYEDENDKPCRVYLSNAMIKTYSRALLEPYVEALKLADEAMMWDVNGEPMPTKEVEARAKIADVLAAHREMFGGE